jgi:hypothetical protein
MVAAAIVIAATTSPAPSPSAAPGPCAQGALASISDRPGLGRAPASNGAACVALPGMFVLEAGYRNQTTVGPGTQTLSTVPNLVTRFGLKGNNEALVQILAFGGSVDAKTAEILNKRGVKVVRIAPAGTSKAESIRNAAQLLQRAAAAAMRGGN